MGRPADRSLFRGMNVELPTDQTSDLFFHCQAPVNEVAEEKHCSPLPKKHRNRLSSSIFKYIHKKDPKRKLFWEHVRT